MPLRAAELEVLFTANLDDVEKGEKTVKQTGERIEKKPITAKVDADPKGALDGMARVEAQAKKIVSQQTALTINANIERAEKSFTRVFERLEYLKAIEPTMEVKADIARAEANLSKVQRNLEGLRSARAEMVVDVDDSPARQKLQSVEEFAGDAGADAGDEFGSNIIAALVSIPIAGAVIGIGVAAGKALVDGFNDGLQIEVGYDRLAALTGLSDADALRVGRAAGEAYANVFGESIEQNMDTARLALQFDLLDADSTTRDAQKIIESLAGLSDVLGEDVQPIARAVTQLLRTGLVKSADEAFDVIAAGAREGVNIGEDLLDTFNEYGTQFRKLGLDGPQALGLLRQALQGGARDSDIAADALKEFAIRATDPAYAEAFGDVGFAWEDLNRRIAAGGPDAAAALEETLDKLRSIEDPAARGAAAMTIFGTQGEDMADALTAMDLSTAVDQLNGVTGAAQTMFDKLSDNDATKMEQAQRNVEVAMAGIQGALAAGFADPLGDLADWVSANRGPLMQFLLDLANGALDFGASVVEGVAAGTEGIGEFVSGPLADLVQGLAAFIGFFDGGAGTGLQTLSEDMRGFKDTTADAAETMRTEWIAAIETARGKMNEFAEPAVLLGYLNDAALRTAGSLESVGLAADGASPLMNGFTRAQDGSIQAGATLEAQIRNTISSLQDELTAAAAAGESQENLQGRYDATTEALVGQLEQMGLTEQEARDLIAAYDDVPDRVATTIEADTKQAQEKVDAFVLANNGRTIKIIGNAALGGPSLQAQGSVLHMMAGGGSLTPMSPVAQAVPPNTWRVIGDRMRDREFYIPDDGSARSRAILLEAMRSFGVLPMAGGGIAGVGSSGPQGPAIFNLYDADNRLIGTMQGEAAAAVQAFASAQAEESRAGYVGEF